MVTAAVRIALTVAFALAAFSVFHLCATADDATADPAGHIKIQVGRGGGAEVVEWTGPSALPHLVSGVQVRPPGSAARRSAAPTVPGARYPGLKIMVIDPGETGAARRVGGPIWPPDAASGRRDGPAAERVYFWLIAEGTQPRCGATTGLTTGDWRTRQGASTSPRPLAGTARLRTPSPATPAAGTTTR